MVRTPGPVAVSLGLAAIGLAAACESLPPLTFYGDDASAEAAAPAGDAGSSVDASTSEAGGPILDASLDQAALDASPGCPAIPPDGAALCCDQIPCNGDLKKCAAACPNCEATCNVGQNCCLAKNGSIADCTASACP